jgi:hypothetical protein
MPFGKQLPSAQAIKIRTDLKGECGPRTWFSISRLTLTSRARLTRRAFDRVAVEILDAHLLVPSHCMMRAMPTADLLGHPLLVAFGGKANPRSTIVEQLLDAAENFLQTPRERAADRRLAGEEVRNPTLEPLDRTEGMRPHRIQIEQAAELVFPE